MLKDSQPSRYSVRRTHRTYSPQFKAELVALCLRPGASIAAVALDHAMNTNVLHRWLKEYRQGLHRPGHRPAGAAIVEPHPHQEQTAAFIPIELAQEMPQQRVQPPRILPAAAPAEPQARGADIRIQCHRPGLSVTIDWPVSAWEQCAQALRCLLP